MLLHLPIGGRSLPALLAKNDTLQQQYLRRLLIAMPPPLAGQRRAASAVRAATWRRRRRNKHWPNSQSASGLTSQISICELHRNKRKSASRAKRALGSLVTDELHSPFASSGRSGSASLALTGAPRSPAAAVAAANWPAIVCPERRPNRRPQSRANRCQVQRRRLRRQRQPNHTATMVLVIHHCGQREAGVSVFTGHVVG